MFSFNKCIILKPALSITFFFCCFSLLSIDSCSREVVRDELSTVTKMLSDGRGHVRGGTYLMFLCNLNVLHRVPFSLWQTSEHIQHLKAVCDLWLPLPAALAAWVRRHMEPKSARCSRARVVPWKQRCYPSHNLYCSPSWKSFSAWPSCAQCLEKCRAEMIQALKMGRCCCRSLCCRQSPGFFQMRFGSMQTCGSTF